jgi:hypothetical protein
MADYGVGSSYDCRLRGCFARISEKCLVCWKVSSALGTQGLVTLLHCALCLLFGSLSKSYTRNPKKDRLPILTSTLDTIISQCNR